MFDLQSCLSSKHHDKIPGYVSKNIRYRQYQCDTWMEFTDDNGSVFVISDNLPKLFLNIPTDFMLEVKKEITQHNELPSEYIVMSSSEEMKNLHFWLIFTYTLSTSRLNAKSIEYMLTNLNDNANDILEDNPYLSIYYEKLIVYAFKEKPNMQELCSQVIK